MNSRNRAGILAQELKLLELHLADMGLSDYAIQARLRAFKISSDRITYLNTPDPELVRDDIDEAHWTITFYGTNLGKYPSAWRAREAYMQAHIEKHGIRSEYHPDYPQDASHLNPDGTPKRQPMSSEKRAELTKQQRGRAASAAMETNGSGLPTGVSRCGKRFAATIKSAELRKVVRIGTFDTPEQAHEAFKKRHIEYHGENSRYYTSDTPSATTSDEDDSEGSKTEDASVIVATAWGVLPKLENESQERSRPKSHFLDNEENAEMTSEPYPDAP